MTVYMTHESRSAGIDLTPAKKFGELRTIFSRDFSPGFYPTEAFAAAETWANEFDFDRDYLVIAGGDPLAGMIAMAALAKVAADEKRTEVNYLRYTKRKYQPGGGYEPTSDYIPIKLKIR